MLNLKKHDYIVTAFAESARGLGWANQLIWVVIRSKIDGMLRLECIQSRDQTKEMVLLYSISQCAHLAMTKQVQNNSVFLNHESLLNCPEIGK